MQVMDNKKMIGCMGFKVPCVDSNGRPVAIINHEGVSFDIEWGNGRFYVTLTRKSGAPYSDRHPDTHEQSESLWEMIHCMRTHTEDIKGSTPEEKRESVEVVRQCTDWDSVSIECSHSTCRTLWDKGRVGIGY